MNRKIMWASLMALAISIGGCKKDQTEDPAATEVQAEGVQVNVGQGGASVKVKTGEGTVNIKTGAGGASVKATTKEGSADINADESGATVKAKSSTGTTTVKADDEGKTATVKTPGQPGINIQRDKGRMKINVGGLKVDVPDTDDDE